MPNLHVLFADDEPDIREIIAISLALDPFFVARDCSSGNEALKAALEWRPDLILLDVMMPVMDGLTTLAQLRADSRTATIPVVLVTARTQSRECARFRSLGAAGVIPKPFDPMELPGLVRGYLPADINLPCGRDAFLRSLGDASAALAVCRTSLAQEHEKARERATLNRIKKIAHTLAAASGVHGFAGIRLESFALKEAAVCDLAGQGAPLRVEHALDRVLSRIDMD